MKLKFIKLEMKKKALTLEGLGEREGKGESFPILGRVWLKAARVVVDSGR